MVRNCLHVDESLVSTRRETLELVVATLAVGSRRQQSAGRKRAPDLVSNASDDHAVTIDAADDENVAPSISPWPVTLSRTNVTRMGRRPVSTVLALRARRERLRVSDECVTRRAHRSVD